MTKPKPHNKQHDMRAASFKRIARGIRAAAKGGLKYSSEPDFITARELAKVCRGGSEITTELPLNQNMNADTSAQARPSPLPWTVMLNGNKPPKIIQPGKPGFIAQLGIPYSGARESNAAYIIKACNAYPHGQGLVNAIKALIHSIPNGEHLADMVEHADAAIALWEKQT